MSTTASTAPADERAANYVGDNKALLGIVLGVVTFWLFAQTTLNIGPVMGADLGLDISVTTIAISLSALFSGMFIVVAGGMADKIGRVRIATIGNVLGIAGSLLIALAFGSVGTATAMLLVGRALQGLSAAFIMPSTMALLKTYWHGPDRQRAVSMWSIGSWGGSGLAAIFGGLMAGTFLGWRSIFIISAVVSLISIVLMRGIPESAPSAGRASRTDWGGIISLAVTVLSLLVFITQGSNIGWTNPITWAILAVFFIALAAFVVVERRVADPLVDFSLFAIPQFTGATISNLLLNATAGLIPVSLWVLQGAGGMSAQTSGYLTLGYAVFIIAFIRVGEKLLQRFGAKKPMIWGTLIVIVAILLLMGTNTLVETYVVLAIIAYSLFGLGLAFYATPSTDMALSALPEEKAGSGSGIYKMASSIGSAFGVAIPAAIFNAMSVSGSQVVGEVMRWSGRQDNLAVREAGMFGLAAVLIMALIALTSIIFLIPNDSKKKEKTPA